MEIIDGKKEISVLMGAKRINEAIRTSRGTLEKLKIKLLDTENQLKNMVRDGKCLSDEFIELIDIRNDIRKKIVDLGSGILRFHQIDTNSSNMERE